MTTPGEREQALRTAEAWLVARARIETPTMARVLEVAAWLVGEHPRYPVASAPVLVESDEQCGDWLQRLGGGQEGFRCTRPRGHDGWHTDHDGTDATRWDTDWTAPVEQPAWGSAGPSGAQCGATTPAGVDGSEFLARCTLPPRHVGCHEDHSGLQVPAFGWSDPS